MPESVGAAQQWFDFRGSYGTKRNGCAITTKADDLLIANANIRVYCTADASAYILTALLRWD